MTGIVDQFKEVMEIAVAFNYSKIWMNTDEAIELLAYIEGLEGAGRLILRHFDEIDDDKWATRGMQWSVESLKELLEREGG